MWNYLRCTLFCLICCSFVIKRSASTITTPRIKIFPEAEGNFIYFEHSDAAKQQQYIDSINRFLDDYDDMDQVETLRNCDFNDTPVENSVCAFDKNSLGRCSQLKDYGFSKDSPCVFFTLSQVLNWVPVVLNGSDVQRHSDPFFNIPQHLNSTLALNDSEKSLEKYIWITCDGENAADKEFIGPVTYYPQKGFPTYYFPFTNQRGYQSPIVAVHFERPMRGVAISIECKIWAKNIQLDRDSGVGFVKFLLLID